MVDLGFLLITFFIFTTSMAESKGLKLYMPVDKGVNGSNLPASKALTVLLAGGDSIYYYHGQWEEAIASNKILLTNYNLQNGLGQIIHTKQKSLGFEKDELMLVIKPSQHATYNKIVNMLDEVEINGLKKYAIVEPSEVEKAFLQQ